MHPPPYQLPLFDLSPSTVRMVRMKRPTLRAHTSFSSTPYTVSDRAPSLSTLARFLAGARGGGCRRKGGSGRTWGKQGRGGGGAGHVLRVGLKALTCCLKSL